MPLTPDELEHMADEGAQRSGACISHTLYCGVCGYNLKSLPYVYNCPECGNAYSARALSMRGIYRPGDDTFPAARIITAGFCGLIGTGLTIAGIIMTEWYNLIFGAIFDGITAVLVYKS